LFGADDNGSLNLTIAATTPFGVTEKSAPPNRTVGVVAIATGIAALALLASHPSDEARTFADVLKSEAANRLIDGIVHGGFIAVLGLQLVCYSVFSVRLGLSRVATIAGLVFFAMGAVFLSGSMVIDGLATPVIAARYLVAPDKLEYAKSLFVLMGTLVGLLMPIGLMFHSAAIMAWSWALASTGRSRFVGIAGLGLGGAMGVALTLGFVQLNPLVLMGTLVGTALWACSVGALLMRQN
jgi:hypothetical protein